MGASHGSTMVAFQIGEARDGAPGRAVKWTCSTAGHQVAWLHQPPGRELRHRPTITLPRGTSGHRWRAVRAADDFKIAGNSRCTWLAPRQYPYRQRAGQAPVHRGPHQLPRLHNRQGDREPSAQPPDARPPPSTSSWPTPRSPTADWSIWRPSATSTCRCTGSGGRG